MYDFVETTVTGPDQRRFEAGLMVLEQMIEKREAYSLTDTLLEMLAKDAARTADQFVTAIDKYDEQTKSTRKS